MMEGMTSDVSRTGSLADRATTPSYMRLRSPVAEHAQATRET